MEYTQMQLSGASWNYSNTSSWWVMPHLLGTWVMFTQPAVSDGYLLYVIPANDSDLHIPNSTNAPLPGINEPVEPLKSIEPIWRKRAENLNLTHPERWKFGIPEQSITALEGKNPAEHLKPVTAMTVIQNSNIAHPTFRETIKKLFGKDALQYEFDGISHTFTLTDKQDTGVFLTVERLDSAFTILKVTTVSPMWKNRPTRCVLDKYRARHIIQAIDAALTPVQNPWETDTPDGLLELAKEFTRAGTTKIPFGIGEFIRR